MATRWIGVESTDPRLPDVVITATKGTTSADFAPGNVAVNKADKATTVTASTPLTGSGTLGANLTLGISSFGPGGTLTAPGAVPTSPGGTVTFLRADGTWSTPPGGGGGISGITVTKSGVAAGSDITVLDFESSFNVTESPAGEANVFLDLSGYTGTGLLPQAKVTGSGGTLTTELAGKADTSTMTTALAGKQPLDADLTTIAGLTATTDNVIQSSGSAWASRTPAQLKGTLALVKGDVGLGNVDNTSDANKPVSSATTTALAAKVDKAYTLFTTAPLTIGGTTSADFTTARTLAINTFTNTTSGIVPSPGGTAGTYMRSDATWVNPHIQLTTDVQFRTGQFVSGGAGATSTRQISLSYNGVANNYRHDILSSHNSGAIDSNSIVFKLWQPIDNPAGAPTNTVLTLEGTLITGTKPFVSQNAAAEYRLIETDQPAENTTWRIISQGGVLNFISTLDNLTAVGTISMTRTGLLAANFSGNGSLLTNLNASNISSGTLANTRLNTLIDSNTTGYAARLSQARLIQLTGDVTGQANFDGTADITIATTAAVNAVTLGTDTVGNYIATVVGTANQVNVSGSGTETAAVTLSTPQDIHLLATPTFARLTLSQITGTSPLVVTSSTLVANLNADKLDSEDGADFHDLTKATGNLPTARLVGQYTNVTRVGTLDQLQVTGPTTFSVTPLVGTDPVWHKGNDGAGSQLDADRLDGKESSEFASTEILEALLGDLLYVGLYNAAGYISGNDATKPHPVWSEGSDVYRSGMYWIVGSSGVNMDFLDTDYSGRFTGEDEAKSLNYGDWVVTVHAGYAVTNKALTSNVATLTIGTHTLGIGKSIEVKDVDAIFDGIYTITAVAATTISYARTNANIASVADTGTVLGRTLDQMVFQYIPFSTETYVKNAIGAHMADVNDPHSAAGYINLARGAELYAPAIHKHTSDIQEMINTHKQETNPHPIYQTEAESDLRYSKGDHLHPGVYERYNAVFDHEHKTDPHPDYVTHTEADGVYSVIGHRHDGVYSPVGHTHDFLTNKEIVSTDSATSTILYVGNNPPAIPVAGDLWLETIAIGAQVPPAPVTVTLTPSPTQVVVAWDYPGSYTVTNKALTSNTATLTIGTSTLSVGNSVEVAGVDAVFNGIYTLTAVTATTISYGKTNANIASTAATGSVLGTVTDFTQVDWSLNGVSWTTLTATLAPPYIPYVHTSLAERTKHYYRVRGHNPTGWGDFRIASVFTNNAPPNPPTAPSATGLLATSVTLNWTAPSGATTNDPLATANKYEVFLNGVSKGTTNAVSFGFTGLVENVAYTLGVRVKDQAGPNDDALTYAPLYSTLVTIPVTTPNAAPPVPTLPGTPTTKTHDTITLTWNAVSVSDFKEYVVTRTGSPAFTSDTTPTTSYTFTGLNPNTPYTVSVAARDTLDATSAPVNAPSVTTNPTPPDVTPPPPATGLLLKPESTYGHMVARFTPPASDVTQYNINTSVNGVSAATTGWKTAVFLTPVAEPVIDGLSGQTISAQLQLRDAAGNITTQDFTSYTLLPSPYIIYADSTNQWRNTSGGQWGGVGNQNPYYDYVSSAALNALGAWFYGTQITDKLPGRTLTSISPRVEIHMVRQAGGDVSPVRPTYNTHKYTTNPGNVLSKNVTNKALTSNVATLTIGTHTYVAGNFVFVDGVDAVFDGRYPLTAVTATTISYAKTNANVTAVVATGTVNGKPVLDNPLTPAAYDLDINVAKWVALDSTAVGTALLNGSRRGIAVFNSTPTGLGNYAKFASVAESSGSGALRIYHLG